MRVSVFFDHWPIRELHRIDLAPALAQPQLEHRVHRVDVVPDRLDRECAGAWRRRSARRPPAGSGRASCPRRTARCGSPDRRPPSAGATLRRPFSSSRWQNSSPRLLHRHALAVGRRARGLDLPHPAQHALSLRLRESIGAALGADGADLALDAPAVGPVPGRRATIRRPHAACRCRRRADPYRERRSCNHPAEALRVRHVPFMYHFDQIVPDLADGKGQ